MHAPRSGTMLLLCVALVATASIIAFGFVANARSTQISAETLTRAELARAAARMGARHAMEVAMGELARPYSTGEWSLGQFGHLDRDVAANQRPWGCVLNQDGTVCTWNDTDDNVRAESLLFHMHHAWFGDQGSGQAYRSEGGDWPWSTFPDRNISILNPCMPRWIEPNYYNLDGLAKPVRFTQVPTSAPERNAPMWFDARWRPVTSRSEARYRLRYAVAAMDLGGHMPWGHQLDFAAGNPFDHATATPHEWDERIARAYQKSYVSIISKAGVNEANSVNSAMPRTSALTSYLGRGTSAAHDNYGYVRADNYLPGFAAGPAVVPFRSLNIFLEPGFLVQTANNLAYTSTGGPMSWNHARATMAIGLQGGWWSLWTASPFGRTNRQNASPGAWYESAVDTPWRINVLTAPPNIIRYMLWGYLPQVVLKFAVSKEEKFAWDGWKPGANWWDPPQPSWSATAYASTSYNPRAPGGPSNPAVDIQTRHFSPPSISPAQPFAGFEEVDYTKPVTATSYDLLYPGPAADWEDYAATELDRSKNANDGSSADHPIHGLMLGSRSNAWHRPDNWSHWGFYAPGDLTRLSLLSPGGRVSANLDDTGNQDWAGLPAETMRGASAFLSYAFSWGGGRDILNGDRITYEIDTDRGYYHRDSYWLDVMNACAAAISLAKGLHQDASSVGPAARVAYHGTGTPPAKPTHVRDVDRMMLAVLGEWFAGDATAPGSSTTSKPGHIIVYRAGDMATKSPSPRFAIDWTNEANIRSIKAFLSAAKPNGPGLDADAAARKAANMERVLNDWRMSFFGANPTYSDFRGFDFDGDGRVVASFYTGTVTIGGKSYPGKTATAGVGPAPDLRFSLTGFFAFDRVRYVRALVRGQVWDELRRQAIEEANLDTAFAIDPDGDWNPGTKAGLNDSCTLYQRWLNNFYTGEAPRTVE